MEKLIVFTDGASSFAATPKAIAGWSLVIPDLNGTQFIRYGHIPMGTNNQGEIFGTFYLLHLLHTRKDLHFDIISDSQYTIKSINEWRHKWVLSNYDGIKNTNLLVPLFNMWDSHGNSRISWVKGHLKPDSTDLKDKLKVLGNNLADEYAVMGKKQQIRNQKDGGKNIRYVPFDEVSKFFEV